MPEFDQDDHISDEPEGGSDLPAMNSELAETLGDIVAQLVGDLMQIDLQLVKCKRALALLQPKKDGRIDLKFWKKPTIPGKHPSPVRWRRLKAGLEPPRRGVKQGRQVPGVDPRKRRWTAIRVPAQRLSMQAKRSMGFVETHPWVVDVLDTAQKLLEARGRLLEQLCSLRRYEARWGKVGREWVAGVGEDLDAKMPGWEVVAAKKKELDRAEAEEARRLVEETNEADRLRTWVVRND